MHRRANTETSANANAYTAPNASAESCTDASAKPSTDSRANACADASPDTSTTRKHTANDKDDRRQRHDNRRADVRRNW